MCNKDDLVSYLYDDLEAPARAAFERHLRTCADCHDELAATRGSATRRNAKSLSLIHI